MGREQRLPKETRDPMPVFARLKDDVLVITADGDYTPGELARVGARAFEEHPSRSVMPVLLDLSGAAGLESKAPEALKEDGTALAAHRDRISRLAVVVASRFTGLFEPEGSFAEAVGVRARQFPAHAEAVSWLKSSHPEAG